MIEPTAVLVAGTEGLEKTQLTFGMIPLTDCAALVVAKEKGYFKKYGLEVSLSKEASWANIRDKVALGVLDGAQMLASMPIAASIGVGALSKPTLTAFSMDLNGNAITVSSQLYNRMLKADPEAMQESPISARALKKVIDADKAAGEPAMTFAMVFPVSTHHYELRYWMASGGICPDRDVHLIVIPPPQMVNYLENNQIVGYCVGEPWNGLAVQKGIGRTLITSYEIWNNNPEKVLGVNLEWADRYPNTHKAVIMALLEAAQWMDQPENRLEVVKLISKPSYIDVPEEVVKMSMMGTFQYSQGEAPRPLPDFNVFFRYAATFPWSSHAAWFITQMLRWGQIHNTLNIKAEIAKVYRQDIYRAAAKELGLPYPSVDEKTEGWHAQTWTLNKATAPIVMGADRFFDEMTYDPAQLVEYIAGFKIHNRHVSLEELDKVN